MGFWWHSRLLIHARDRDATSGVMLVFGVEFDKAIP
jgi:hypothetical protein